MKLHSYQPSKYPNSTAVAVTIHLADPAGSHARTAAQRARDGLSALQRASLSGGIRENRDCDRRALAGTTAEV